MKKETYLFLDPDNSEKYHEVNVLEEYDGENKCKIQFIESGLTQITSKNYVFKNTEEKRKILANVVKSKEGRTAYKGFQLKQACMSSYLIFNKAVTEKIKKDAKK